MSPPKLPIPTLPPLTAVCQTTLQPPQAGAPSQQSTSQFARSSDGKTRVDQGNTSVINNPATQQTIVLDHIKKEAHIVPPPFAPPAPPKAPPAPGAPQAPAAPAAPKMPVVSVKDLGKKMLEGHEVEGKQYTMPPLQQKMPAVPKMPPKGPNVPGMPKIPGMPKMPGIPKMPGMPQMPGAKPPAAPVVPGAKPPTAPAAPKPPQAPTVAEVWSSPKLQLPLLSRTTGTFGKQTTQYKNVAGGEPPASHFQIPKGYKLVAPPKPALPKLAMPKLAMPKLAPPKLAPPKI